MKSSERDFRATDKENGEEEYMGLEDVKYRIMGNVKDVSLAINDMVINGNKTQTNYQIYEYVGSFDKKERG